jgi:hypothetical protein
MLTLYIIELAPASGWSFFNYLTHLTPLTFNFPALLLSKKLARRVRRSTPFPGSSSFGFAAAEMTVRIFDPGTGRFFNAYPQEAT